ncbi:PEP/pyruvate-binding domain-containing protein [Halodesulfovibrio sp. MK-HDV]|jgi:pyruvate, water dikinase|uniref:PEP/pyruvate-binding domain-containing protein n=1 Tax=Halodesulfovibrio sp. MK-HDV TaxID=2599925 RepID=UPI00136D0132|nr:PEP/pyruvate-binding domain-containing protein [Halodesulfovibrio sp. MK-HDV]KAF1075500.1 Phosphoenolpyruvate synthase [Halodesulfovibrio sp. MK-HDV]
MFITELFKHWTFRAFAPGTLLRTKYNAFKELLRLDERCLEHIADLEEIHYGREQADWTRVVWLTEELGRDIRSLIEQLQLMSPVKYMDLQDYATKLNFYVRMGVSVEEPHIEPPFVFTLPEAQDMLEAAGGKAANLARISSEKDINLLPARVISAHAYHYFVEVNDLREELDKRLSAISLADAATLDELAHEMQQLILQADMPDPIANEIEIAALELGKNGIKLAVRSSAVAEDGAASFAGQYSSVLDVTANNIIQAWKEVVASKYTPRAIAYRIMNGLADTETPMAVLIMPMVDAVCSGVAFSTAPAEHAAHLDEPAVAVYATSGIGEKLVSGSVTAQTTFISKAEKPRIIEKAAQSVVPAPTLKRIAAQAQQLETFFGEPQDVEWVVDHRSRIFIVQSRPVPHSRRPQQTECPAHDLQALDTNKECASMGIGSGKVRVVANCQDITELPHGTILVTRGLGPVLTRVIHRLNGVIAERGSAASHFASVAREFNVPVLCGVEDACTRYTNDQLITVDGTTGSVFDGVLPECHQENIKPQQGVIPRLGKVLPRIARLTLLDPSSESFAPEYCKSLHDLVRFVHEKGVEEMFSLVDKSSRGLSGSRKLQTHLPLSMYVLNLDKGLFHSAAGKKEVEQSDIASVPMWALWFGLSSELVTWHDALPHFDWEHFDKVSAGIISKDSPLLASYAIISDNYMHAMLRFGYHFSVVDCMCGDKDRQNYIRFRFMGGGGKSHQRTLRLDFIERILSKNNFAIERKGDMLNARHGMEEEHIIQQRLALLGLLLAKTRMLDMRLEETSDLDALEKEFFKDLGSLTY